MRAVADVVCPKNGNARLGNSEQRAANPVRTNGSDPKTRALHNQVALVEEGAKRTDLTPEAPGCDRAMEIGDGLAFDGGRVSEDDIADVEVYDGDCEIQPHDLLGKTRPAFAVINEYLHRDRGH